MLIGVPKEIKNQEHRVGLVPSSVRELTAHGHEVIVETNAGIGIGFDDKAYEAVGAKIAKTAKEIFDKAELIVKVKEPQLSECAQLKRDQILFTYLHLAPDPAQAKGLMDSKCVAIAYETVTDNAGRLPLLAPMSDVAGRMSIQVGAKCLEKETGGSGVLLSGVPGVLPGKVTIIGGGVVGTSAARMAAGMEADVTILDKSNYRLHQLDELFGARVKTVYPTLEALEHFVTDSDLVVGAVLVPGAAAPKLVTHAMVKKMRPGSVMVDVAIDQGGCFETSRPTTHTDPTFVLDGVVHYCVTNMPGGVARTSTFALNNATLCFVLKIANLGYQKALLSDNHLMNGLNVLNGKITHPAVAEALGEEYVDPITMLK